MSANPLTPPVATMKRTAAVIIVTDVRVDDRPEALAIAGRDRGAHGFARAHLLLDALEDDDVRVGRDADREDDPGDPGKRQRDVEEEDRPVEEDAVDCEPDDRDDAEEAVEEEQEEGDRDQPADAGDERLAQGVLAERRRDLGPLDLDELDGQRARLEHERQILGLVDAVEPRDLSAAARDSVREVRVGEVDRSGRSGSRCRARWRTPARTGARRPHGR